MVTKMIEIKGVEFRNKKIFLEGDVFSVRDRDDGNHFRRFLETLMESKNTKQDYRAYDQRKT